MSIACDIHLTYHCAARTPAPLANARAQGGDDESAIQGAVPQAGRLAFPLSGGRRRSDNKIALVPGGPHPYFAPWEQAAKDAQKDFGIAGVEYKVPTTGSSSCRPNCLKASPLRASKRLDFPGRPVGANSTISELKATNIPVVALGGCTRSHGRRLLPCNGPVPDHLHHDQDADQAIGGKGEIVHFTGLLIHPTPAFALRPWRRRSRRRRAEVATNRGRTDSEEMGDQKINASSLREGSDRRDHRHRPHHVGGGRQSLAFPRRQTDQVHRFRRHPTCFRLLRTDSPLQPSCKIRTVRATSALSR